jgi:filamin
VFDEHIPGSPFKVMAQGGGQVSFEELQKMSDGSKCRGYGAGLQNAKLGENTFTVDAINAGTNMLLVGVHGPSIPCEEIHVKHLGKKKYSVTYTAEESGSYVLIVKWGDDHIPGSPFRVVIP